MVEWLEHLTVVQKVVGSSLTLARTEFVGCSVH